MTLAALLMVHVSQLPGAAAAALLMTSLKKPARLVPCRAWGRQMGRRGEGKLEHCDILFQHFLS